MHVYSPAARNFLPAGCLLVVPVLTRSVLFVTLESSLTTTSAPQRMCGEGRTVSRCFAALRQLRHLRRYVTDDCFRSLVASLIHSRLDYGNFVLVVLPAYMQRHLQCSTLRLVWFFQHVTTTSSKTLSLLFTDCVYT